MTVNIANAAAIAACAAINTLIDHDSASATAGGFLRIWSGTRPVDANTAPTTQVKLIEFVLPAPVFGTPTIVGTNATATANPVSPTTALATGTATWFNIVDHDGTTILTGSVTDTTGAGDLKLSTVSVVAAIDVSVVSLTASMPTGV